MDLVLTDNRYSPRVALRNAEMLIRERVNLLSSSRLTNRLAPGYPPVSGSFDTGNCSGDSASGSRLLRRQQLRCRGNRRPLPGTLGAITVEGRSR